MMQAGGLPATRVLIVEDHDDTREMLVAWLESVGFEVSSAADGREGLAAARTATPDVILLDLMMPVMSGLEFRVEQQVDPAIAHIPIIVVSAHADADWTAKRMGAAGFVKKPIAPDGLVKTIRETASGSSSRKP